MRKELKNIGDEERHTYTATFERGGFKTSFGHYKPTLLLVNIIESGRNKVVTNHLWVNYGTQFKKLGHLKKGDEIKFNARVGYYTRGYEGNDPYKKKEHPISYDYKLERPSKVSLIAPDAQAREVRTRKGLLPFPNDLG